MNWEAIGALAELGGAIAVIVTLAYLALQLRQANLNIRISVARSQVDSQISWLSQLITDPSTYKLYREGLKGRDSLSIEEKGRFDLLLHQMFIDANTQFRQLTIGAMEDDHWRTSNDALLLLLGTEGGRGSWDRQKSLLADDFVLRVEEILRENQSAD